jgi:hypothetical protein
MNDTTTTLKTTAPINKLLKEAGYRKSETSNGRVRGFSTSSRGFIAELEKTSEQYRHYTATTPASP